MNQCMGMMKTKYNINTMRRKPGSQLDAKTITILRIAASFPSITVRLYMRDFSRNIDPSEIFGKLTLPKALMTPMIDLVCQSWKGLPLL